MKNVYVFFALLTQVCFSQQTKDIGGIIVDSSGNPIAGATIIDKADITKGVISDFDGQFVISIAEASKELEVSFLGFETKLVPITGNFINITLEEKASELQEVTVKGFTSVASKARVRAQAIQTLPETTVAINAATI